MLANEKKNLQPYTIKETNIPGSQEKVIMVLLIVIGTKW